jgi:uncharacterized membrane protein
VTSLIPETELWLLLAIIVVGVAFCIYLEQNVKWAAKISGPVLALVVAMMFSNLRIVPTTAPIYDVVDDYLVPMAVPLLLFQANLRRVLRETGPMFLTFHIASMGTVLGAFAAAWFFPKMHSIEEVVGIMTGSYIGGGVNFVAIAQTYKVPSELTNPLIVADNFIMAGMFLALLILAGNRLFRRWYPHPHSVDGAAEDSTALAAQYWRRKEIALKDIALALAIAIAVVAVSKELSGMVKAHTTSKLVASLFGSPYVLITFFTTMIVTVFPQFMGKINGAEEIGFYLLYLFFFVIGLRADLLAVIKNVPELFVICLIMAVTNLVFTLLVGRLFKLNLEELLLSVNATLGGAPSAAAMAISTGWNKLVLPGVLAAIWGYVIGTFVGIVVAEAVRSWLH